MRGSGWSLIENQESVSDPRIHTGKSGMGLMAKSMEPCVDPGPYQMTHGSSFLVLSIHEECSLSLPWTVEGEACFLLDTDGKVFAPGPGAFRLTEPCIIFSTRTLSDDC